MEINIAFGATKDWFKYTRITITSILRHASKDDNYNFYILCNEYDKEDEEFFAKANKVKEANYNFIKIDESEFDNMELNIGASAYYRIKIPALIDKEKVLYMDSDIVCQSDISEIYAQDVSNYYIGATEDVLGAAWAPKIGLDPNYEQYFNSGVLLMNLNKFRENDLESKIFKLLKERELWDQDVINMVCKGHILSMPIRYNCMPAGKDRVIENEYYLCYAKRVAEYEEALIHPLLIHFTFKPWRYLHHLHAEKWFLAKEFTDKL